MTFKRLPVLGSPTRPIEPLRKIAIEEHFMAPENFGPDSNLDLAAFAAGAG